MKHRNLILSLLFVAFLSSCAEKEEDFNWAPPYLPEFDLNIAVENNAGQNLLDPECDSNILSATMKHTLNGTTLDIPFFKTADDINDWTDIWNQKGYNGLYNRAYIRPIDQTDNDYRIIIDNWNKRSGSFVLTIGDTDYSVVTKYDKQKRSYTTLSINGKEQDADKPIIIISD